MISADRRLKTAAELFAGGRLTAASELAGILWAEGERAPELAVLYGELALLGGRVDHAEMALRLALEAMEGHPRLPGLLAVCLCRAGRLAEAAGLYRRLGRLGLAEKLARLATSGWYRASGAGAEIPWLLDSDLPAVEALVDGVPARFILDTGVGETLLDRGIAGRLGLESLGAERIHFPAGPAGEVDHAILDVLELGSLRVNDLPVQIHPVRQGFAGLLPFPVDGVLGTGLFSQVQTSLDYPGRCLRLSPGRRLGGGAPLFLGGEQYPLVEARLNDRLDTLLFLDTGMSGAALAVPLSIARLADVDLALGRAGAGYGVGQSLQAQPIRCRSLNAAGSTQQDLPGMLLRSFKLERRFAFRIGGLVGDGFVRAGCLELDFASGLVRLQGPEQG
jgi:hypothetical protein